MILGIQDLERNFLCNQNNPKALNALYPKDIEDIVVKNEEKLIKIKI
jgi:hypothetical protein